MMTSFHEAPNLGSTIPNSVDEKDVTADAHGRNQTKGSLVGVDEECSSDSAHADDALHNMNIAPLHTNDSVDPIKKEKKPPSITYAQLLRENPNFRWYLLSYLINKMGEWMTYLASISLIQEATKTRGGEHDEEEKLNTNTNTMVSILVLVKLLPNVFFLPMGGILADSYDRRSIQTVLGVCSSFVVVIFWWAVSENSMTLCLVGNFVTETFFGLYYPSNSAMLPQLFGVSGGDATIGSHDKMEDESNHQEYEEECLKKANVLHDMTWSLMAAIGSSLGGVLVSAFGIRGCFVIDSVTYLISAAILQFGVQGNYTPVQREQDATTREDGGTSEEDHGRNHAHRSRSLSNTSEELSLFPCRFLHGYDSLPQQTERDERTGGIASFQDSNARGEIGGNNTSPSTSGLFFFLEALKFLFLQNPLYGACALLKASSSLSFGACDILNVSFSARGTETDASKTSLKLGLLFGSVGIGCILGSMATGILSDFSRPRRNARLCLAAFTCQFVALFWMASAPDTFWSLCFSTILRSIGTSGIWVNSTLMIQKVTPQYLLGRVNSFDSGMTMLAEALSALGGGVLMDQKGLLPEDLSVILAVIALFFFFFWSPLSFRL